MHFEQFIIWGTHDEVVFTIDTDAIKDPGETFQEETVGV